MGYNTTIVVMNDSLGDIESDPEFGKRLVTAIRSVNSRGLSDVSAHGKYGIACNAARVIETHHSSYDVIVKIGGNTGTIVREEA